MFLNSKLLARKTVITHAKKRSDHSIFQIDSRSPFVSVKDVREAFEVTKHMTSYQRLRYFRQMGIDYKRSLKYMQMIENFNQNLKTTESLDEPLSEFDDDASIITVDIDYTDEDERFPSESADELAKWIEKAASSSRKSHSKISNQDKIKSFVQSSLSITFIFVALLIAKYIVEQQ